MRAPGHRQADRSRPAGPNFVPRRPRRPPTFLSGQDTIAGLAETLTTACSLLPGRGTTHRFTVWAATSVIFSLRVLSGLRECMKSLIRAPSLRKRFRFIHGKPLPHGRGSVCLDTSTHTLLGNRVKTPFGGRMSGRRANVGALRRVCHLARGGDSRRRSRYHRGRL